MLIRSTWTLTVSEPVTLPRSYHLELVKMLHQRLDLVMGEEKISTSSFSGIMGRGSVQSDFITFSPDNFYQLSLSGLTETTAKAIASLNLSDSLRFLGATFNVINREDDITSYEHLYTSLVAQDPEPIKRFNLQFLTPTAFSQAKVSLPLPVPSLMFRSWLERWNYFAPIYLGGDELLGYFENAIALPSHKIKTQLHQLHRGYVIGFMGEVRLQVLRDTDPLLANVANLLIHYGQFAGTGVKTRLGMGKTVLQG